MRYSLAFDFSDFNRNLVIEHKKYLREVFEKNQKRFTDAVKQKFASKIRTSSEYRSLVSPQGALHVDLGLGELGGDWSGKADAVSALADIVEQIIAGVTVTITDRKAEEDFVIGLNIKLLENLDDIINSESGKYVSINARGDYNEVPWLEWLLTGGSSSVVVGYHVLYKDSEASRTLHAVMVKQGSFSIDGRFTGTKNNNFITRAAEDMNEDISDLIDKHFIAKLS